MRIGSLETVNYRQGRGKKGIISARGEMVSVVRGGEERAGKGGTKKIKVENHTEGSQRRYLPTASQEKSNHRLKGALIPRATTCA